MTARGWGCTGCEWCQEGTGDGWGTHDATQAADAGDANLTRERWQVSDGRPSTDELLGIAPDWLGGLSVDEYLREIRE